jgi:lipopolysaccharide export system protein LptA
LQALPVLPAAALLLAALSLASPAARAEKADSRLPMEIRADRSGSADLLHQVSRFEGHVVITQGTLRIQAERVEVRQTPDGFYQATAWGSPAAPVRYRQKREGVDEYVEGQAQRVEFDGKSEVLRLIGDALVRRVAGERTLDEITGARITWNHASEQFSAEGGSSSAGAGGSGGDTRVRAVLAPRSAADPVDPASAAASAGAAPRRTGR